MPKKACKKYTSIGGQALIEGIMMRGPSKTAIALRRPNGEISIESFKTTSLKDKYKWLGLPLIRGVAGYVESMMFGYKALMRSADVAAEEPAESQGETSAESYVALDAAEGELVKPDMDCAIAPELKAGDDNKEDIAEPNAKPSEKTDKKEDSKFFGFIMILSSVLGVLLAVVLFMYLPSLLFNWINSLAGGGYDKIRAVFEGFVKIILFIIYLAAVSLMPDIKRVFQYHGAEHKTIFAYEAKLPLTTENVRAQSRFHPRCGTSFLVLILLVSMAIGIILSVSMPWLTKNLALWVAVKILVLPLTCGIGYELIKLCGKYDNIITRIISAPGMWVQRLTTKEPDDEMIEIGIKSLEAVIPSQEAEIC